MAGAFVGFWILCAVAPYDRAVWWAENIPVLAAFLGLALTHRRFAFSNLAYGLMSVWLFLHTLGGHFSFALVPFDWASDLLGASRNHFDRFAHYSIGFFAYPIVELLRRKKLAAPKTALCFGVLAIMALAGAYEIIEWWYAVLEGGEAGIAVLGAQGDVWDAQKDMLADTLGALTAVSLYRLVNGADRPHC